MVVQLIMGWRHVLSPRSTNTECRVLTPIVSNRTYNISQRRKPVFYFLTSLYIAVITVRFLLLDRTFFPSR